MKFLIKCLILISFLLPPSTLFAENLKTYSELYEHHHKVLLRMVRVHQFEGKNRFDWDDTLIDLNSRFDSIFGKTIVDYKGNCRNGFVYLGIAGLAMSAYRMEHRKYLSGKISLDDFHLDVKNYLKQARSEIEKCLAIKK